MLTPTAAGVAGIGAGGLAGASFAVGSLAAGGAAFMDFVVITMSTARTIHASGYITRRHIPSSFRLDCRVLGPKNGVGPAVAPVLFLVRFQDPESQCRFAGAGNRGAAIGREGRAADPVRFGAAVCFHFAAGLGIP